MNWDSIIGHTLTIANLRAMLQADRMPHALLFAGPEGVGKMLTAGVLSAALLCESAAKPCGRCPSCRQFAQNNHPDFSLIRPEGASIRIEQIRALQHQVSLVPYLGDRRVVVIENSDKMTTQAANSLLKVLEEPPGHAVFILVTARRQMLLDTIISRCLTVGFQAQPWQDLLAALVAKGYPAREAEVAVRLGNGKMGTALGLLEPDGLRVRDQAFTLVAALTDTRGQALWTLPEELEKYTRQDVLELLHYVTLLLRDILVYRVNREQSLLFNIDLAGQLAEQALYWEETALLAAFGRIRQAERALTGNGNIRLVLEALLIHIMEMMKGGQHFASSSGSAI